MSAETKRLKTISENKLRKIRGGDEAAEPETSRSRPLTGFYNDAMGT